jgi:hypothetical protein
MTIDISVTLREKINIYVYYVGKGAELIKHYAMKTYGGGRAPPFLTLAVDGSERSTSRPCPFTPVQIARGSHWIGGRVGPRASLDTMEKRTILILPGIELRPSSQ